MASLIRRIRTEEGVLTNPRAPTTTAPRSRAGRSLLAKWALLGPRMPDRGGHVPVNGLRQMLPNGEVGGVPRIPKPLFSGLELAPLPKASVSQALTLATAMKQRINALRLEGKPKVHLVPGDYGLYYATGGPQRWDPRVGRKLWRAGLPDDVRKARTVGQFAQNRTVPASTQLLHVARRLKREATGSRVTQYAVRGGEAGDYVAPDTASVQRIGAKQVQLANQPDWGKQPVRPAPENELTTEVGNQRQPDWTQVLFLIAAVVIGGMVLRRA